MAPLLTPSDSIPLVQILVQPTRCLQDRNSIFALFPDHTHHSSRISVGHDEMLFELHIQISREASPAASTELHLGRESRLSPASEKQCSHGEDRTRRTRADRATRSERAEQPGGEEVGVGLYRQRARLLGGPAAKIICRIDGRNNDVCRDHRVDNADRPLSHTIDK